MRSMFLAHGSPMNALAVNDYTRFLNRLGESMAPDAVISVSAHWESPVLSMTRTDEVYETVYDFWGFPKELYEVVYPARGSAAVADAAAKCLSDAGISCYMDETRGMDHGTWTLLVHLFPKADVSVVQMSLNAALSAGEQLRIGAAFGGLKDKNILLVGSGVTVHNLRLLEWDRGFDTPCEPWALEFDDWLISRFSSGPASLQNWMAEAPHARKAAPTLEHFVPYLIAAGAGTLPVAKQLARFCEMGCLTYMGVEF